MHPRTEPEQPCAHCKSGNNDSYDLSKMIRLLMISII
jgi:hypothetical protein